MAFGDWGARREVAPSAWASQSFVERVQAVGLLRASPGPTSQGKSPRFQQPSLLTGDWWFVLRGCCCGGERCGRTSPRAAEGRRASALAVPGSESRGGAVRGAGSCVRSLWAGRLPARDFWHPRPRQGDPRRSHLCKPFAICSGSEKERAMRFWNVRGDQGSLGQLNAVFSTVRDKVTFLLKKLKFSGSARRAAAGLCRGVTETAAVV